MAPRTRKLLLQLLAYGGGLAAIGISLQLLRYSYLMRDWTLELYLLAVGVPVGVGGVMAGRWWSARKQMIRRRPDPLITPLTPRELEILERVSSGLSNQEIAEQSFVSVSTVKTHLQSIYGKLEVRRRTQAVDRARNLGLID